MKRITLALGLLSAGITGCMSMDDSRVVMRGDIVSESEPISSDRESPPRPRPIVDRWHRMIANIRESARESHGPKEGMAQGLDVTSVPITAVAQGSSREEDHSQVVIRSGGVVRSERPKTLPSSTSVVQAGASETDLSSEPKKTPVTGRSSAHSSEKVAGRSSAAGTESGANASSAAVVSSENASDKTAEGVDSQPGKTPTRTVNSKRIVVDYEIKDIGPSGISTVDLYYTREGRKWEKCPVGPQRSSPYILEVREEGLYGITLVASSGIGLKKRPPRPGDSPQIWIDVDVTKPLVRLTGCTVGTGTEADSLTINWKAQDKHFGDRPITLSYAEQAEGPWSTIVANTENSGNYVWKMPTSVPQRLFVRLEAADLAGNVGMCQTRQPVLVDLAKPSVSILTVKPAAN